MNETKIATLAQVTLEVLERYAFMMAEPRREEEGAADFPTPLWITMIMYVGPYQGVLGIMAPPALARQAAANLYGVELYEVGEEQAQDALKELLNVACGDYLSEIEGDEPIFDLTPPSIESLDYEAAMQRVRDKPNATLNVEGVPLMVFIEG